jgi:ABC-2 type transport system ATP-binding protein
MIKVLGLKKKFNDKVILEIPELIIGSKGIVALVGNNGAGKTTFLRILSDLLEPTEGVITYEYKKVKSSFNPKQIAMFLDETFLIEYLTVKEYFNLIILFNKLNKIEFNEGLNRYSKLFCYEEFKDKQICELSLGNKNKVGILSALLQGKEVTILDEPFANLDPSSQHLLCQYLKDFHNSNLRVVILSSHNIENMVSISDRILLLEKGKIIKDVEPDYNTIDQLRTYFIAN